MAAAAQKPDLVAAYMGRYGVPEPVSNWASTARNDAIKRFQTMGVPGRRDEYWRYTRATGFDAAARAADMLDTDEKPVFDAVDKLLIVFIDGIYRADLSDDLSGENLEIQLLEDALDSDIHWAKDVFGVLETAGQAPVARPFAAMNTALATQGVVIRATGKVAKPVALRYLRADAGADVLLHHVIRVENGADLTLLENGPSAARVNQVLEVDIADKGSFHHVRAQGRDPERTAHTHLFARLGNESLLKSFTLTVNGVLTRNEYVVEVSGNNATAHIAGACLGDGAFHHDDTVFITHDAVDCESRQVFKKVLKNGATGVFQGKILVKPDAQKTDGYQISQALLLDDDSNFLAKPELEIYADDVICSHGSTCGAVDETSMFYLMSRGIPRAEAQNMMIAAFLDEAIAEIENEAISDDIRSRLSGWTERHS